MAKEKRKSEVDAKKSDSKKAMTASIHPARYEAQERKSYQRE